MQSSTMMVQQELGLPVRAADLAQTSYSGVIPMDLTVMVGVSGNDVQNAFNYLAAVPFAIRSNSTHTASGLILPDDIESYASPLDDWVEFLGGSLNELVFLGDVQNSDHLALTSIADSLTEITGTDHITMAANLAQEFFVGSPSVGAVETPNANQFSDSITMFDVTDTLSGMSSSS